MTGGTPSPDPAELRSRLRAASARIEEALAEYKETQRRNEPGLERIERARAEDARSGKLGSEWTKVQQRIDLGQTSLQDVFGDVDDSAEAGVLRTYSHARLRELGDALEDEADEADAAAAPVETPLADVRGMNARFLERVESLRRYNDSERD